MGFGFKKKYKCTTGLKIKKDPNQIDLKMFDLIQYFTLKLVNYIFITYKTDISQVYFLPKTDQTNFICTPSWTRLATLVLGFEGFLGHGC